MKKIKDKYLKISFQCRNCQNYVTCPKDPVLK